MEDGGWLLVERGWMDLRGGLFTLCFDRRRSPDLFAVLAPIRRAVRLLVELARYKATKDHRGLVCSTLVTNTHLGHHLETSAQSTPRGSGRFVP
jgi:hypothetical protein